MGLDLHMNPKTRDEIIQIQKRRTAFLVSENSPIPTDSSQRGFRGLDYFPIDPKYQFPLSYKSTKVYPWSRSPFPTGSKCKRKAGFLEFVLENKKILLQVYKKNQTTMRFSCRSRTRRREEKRRGRKIC